MESKCPQCGAIIRFQGLCLKCQKENEEKEILEMSAEELEEKINELADDYDEDQCKLLIRLRGINTEKLARAAWENEELGFAPVYKDAPDDVTSEMIEELLNGDIGSNKADKLLICLAHRGGEVVLKAFRELEENPREWRKKLHVDPHVYANEGGWTFDKDGKVTQTVFRKCYPVIGKTPKMREERPREAHYGGGRNMRGLRNEACKYHRA